MIKTKAIENGYTKIYSDEGLMIRNSKTKAIHSEYVVKDASLKDYEEVRENA